MSKKTSEAKYVIGIDLGTTNSALAYAEIRADADPFAPANVQLLPVPQLTNPGEVRDEDLLPSFLYLPGAERFSGRASLATAVGRGRARTWSGAWRRSAAWRTPDGWCRPPRAGCRIPAWTAPSPLLPFRAPEGVAKISPVEASRRYLEHLREAWDAKMPDAPFAEQQVLVTVPASFDAVARELTLEAGEAGRISEHHAARRAAGGLLRLDRAASGLARAGDRWAT